MTNLQGFAYTWVRRSPRPIRPVRPLRLAALALSAALLAGMLSGCAFGPDHARPPWTCPTPGARARPMRARCRTAGGWASATRPWIPWWPPRWTTTAT